MFDSIVIGGGPAGVTAGIYLARKKLDALVISKDFVGQVGKTSSIENWPGTKDISGMEFLGKLKDHLDKFMISINEGEEVSSVKKKKDHFEVITTEKDRYFTKSIIICTGANPRFLQVPGEKEFTGKGVAYCATCDAPMFKDKTVAVIGGGNAGFESAIDLSKYAAKIYILEFNDKFVADEYLVDKAKKTKKVELLTSVAVKEIKGDKMVKSLIYQDRKKKENKEIEVEGVFVQIGHVPTSSFVKGLVDFNKKNEIKIDPKTNQTKTPGVFAAGDVSSVPYKQIVIAAGEGAKAALSCYNYLQGLDKK